MFIPCSILRVLLSLELRKQKEVKALSDYQYKISLELNEMKGQSLTKSRKELTAKQRLIGELRRQLSIE